MTLSPLPQILVVDDDLAVGQVLVALLTQAQFSVEHVTSAELALEALTRHPYDLLVSDLKMAGMDGMTLLRQVRGHWPESRSYFSPRTRRCLWRSRRCARAPQTFWSSPSTAKS